MSFEELAKARYSCRRFKDTPVEAEKLRKLLEIANAAPTATNAQPVRLWVLQSPEALEKVNRVTRCGFGAPLVIAVGGRHADGWTRPSDGRTFADVDASIVGTHIMLAATDLGLGSTWVGWFDCPKLVELFPEMAGWDMVALFPIGYPDAGPGRHHGERKPLSELCVTL